MIESIWTAESVKTETPNIMVRLVNDQLVEAQAIAHSENWVRIECAGTNPFFLFYGDVARLLNENKPARAPHGAH